MTLSFRDMQDADLENVFLNTNEYAESLYYCPKGGTRRTIAGSVEEIGSFPDEDGGKFSLEYLDIMVRRHATEGIDEPQLGDAITRLIDDPDKGYSYTGEKSDVDVNCWTLRFVRKVPYKLGGSRIQ